MDKINVTLEVTKIKKHIPDFAFDEIYEDIDISSVSSICTNQKMQYKGKIMQINEKISTKINTDCDTLKERYIRNSQLVGKYEFPMLKPVNAWLDDVKAVAFPQAKNEKFPRQSFCHFFVNDYTFERLWVNASKHIDYLRNFKYVCSPDFSLYTDMPLALQIYNVYRSRALGFCLSMFGIDVIPTVTWGDESTFDFCFDGLPQQSTLAVSTNGCFFDEGKMCYINGFKEMCERLNPTQVLVVGREIPIDVDVKITYKKSYGQEMTERLRNKK